MTETILNLCREILKPGNRVVVAVSGGADSMCLVHALHRVAGECGAQVFVAHINHQLRGEAAEADARFVCAWARERGLPRLIARVDVKRVGGQSEENIARQQRYRALVRICRHFAADRLAVAHHADDQVETFLLNLLRGSGGRGLQGMPATRQLSAGTKLIRPLLAVTRLEIEAYCQENLVSWRQDATNDSDCYQRNIIRHQLLPQLRKFNPAIDEVLLNTMEILRGDQQLLDGLTYRALSKLTVPSPLSFAPLALSSDGLKSVAPALQNRLILSLLPKFSGLKHVKAIVGLLGSQAGASIDLPGKRRAYRLYDSIAIGCHPPSFKVSDTFVTIPGREKVGALTIDVVADKIPDSWVFWLPQSATGFIVGSRRPGDYFYPAGGKKKLKDYMIDKKIPRWLRDRYLVFRCGGEIFWIAGLARDWRFIQPGPGKRPIYIRLINKGGKGIEQTDGS